MDRARRGTPLARLRRQVGMLVTSPDVSRARILDRRGLIDVVSPHVLYAAVYLLTQEVSSAAISVSVWCAGLVSARLLMRQPLRPVLAGLVLVVISGLPAICTGRGADFYLLHIVRSTIWVLVLLLSLIGRYPMVGVIVGPVVGGAKWQQEPILLRAYRICTAIWAGAIGLRLAAHIPFYLADDVAALGVAHLVTGLPAFAVISHICLRILRNAYAAHREG
ncbi:DUF3159 domain-containing protein [Nocardia grenadensis]|uniref:DUF3159 domain-containing protein n=1 Tax=Nocardia grenadensis TaxID=931537 RepID=UPI003D8D79F8